MTLRRLVAPWRDRNAEAASRPDDGLTLIEMVVALGIVVVLLLSAGGALITITQAQRSAEANDRAIHLANDRLEKIRRLSWATLGSNGPTSPTPDPGYLATVPVAKTSSGTDIIEKAVNLKGAADPSLSITQTENVGQNAFTVTTRVTWAKIPNTTTDPADVRSNVAPYSAGADGIPDYAHKRILVTVSWKKGTQTRSITAQTMRAPTLSEAIPTTVGIGASDGCTRPSSSPFCSLYVTTGKVMTNSGTGSVTSTSTLSSVATPIQMRAVTRAAVASVSAKAGTFTFPLIGSTDGKTWTLPNVGGGKALPLGPVSVVFTTSTGSTDTYTTGSWQTTPAASAKIAPTTAGPTWLVAAPGNLRGDLTRAAGDVTALKGTTEPTAQSFCVDPSGNLWFYQALLFDVQNIDDMDAPTGQPAVRYTGAPDPTSTSNAITKVLPAGNIGHPSAANGSYATTGYVGTVNAGRGMMNTQRWYAAFPKGHPFRAGQDATNPGQTTLTLSQTRPADAVTVSATLTVPVIQQANPDDCGLNAPPTPTVLSASATGTTVNVTWGAVNKATSYRLYRAVQNTASDPLTYSQAYSGTATSWSYTAAAGQKISFYLVAVNANGDSPNSAPVSTYTIPDPSGTVTADYLQSGTSLIERVTLSAVSPWPGTAVTMYRSNDGAADVSLGAASNTSGTTWSVDYLYGTREVPALGVNRVFSAEACNAAGCAPKKASAVTRMPYWFGINVSAPVMVFTGDETPPSGVVTNLTGGMRIGGTFTTGQPGSFRSDKSILFTTSAWLAQDNPVVAAPSGAGARTVEFAYKESGGYSAGWLFNQPGTTASNGFGAKNTAAGQITIGDTNFSGLKLNDGQWHFYIISLYSGKVYIAEDGVSKYAGAVLTTPINTPTTSRFLINHDGTNANSGVSGWYDHFSRYNVALNGATEFSGHFNGLADE